MFKVDLKTMEVKKSTDKLPSVEELIPKPGFNIRLKKMKPVKTF